MSAGRLNTARVAILTIIEEEFDAVRTQLGGATVREIGTTGVYSPDPDACDVVLAMSTERSNVPANESSRDLLEQVRPELLMVCGVAGGIAGRGTAAGAIAPGHVVVADTLHYVAFRKLTEGQDALRHYAHDPPSAGLVNRHARPVARDMAIVDELAGECPAPRRRAGHDWPPRIHVGPIIVGESVMGDPRHPEQRVAAGRVDNALAIDMESIGVARAIHTARDDVNYNPRLIVIRAVSDMVEVADSAAEAEDTQAQESNNLQRQEWKPFAAAAAACVAGRIAGRFLADPDPRQRVRHAGQAPTQPTR